MGEITQEEWQYHKNALDTWTITRYGHSIGQIYLEFTARLICAAVNACRQVNPKNPIAAAEALPDLLAACKAWDKYARAAPPVNKVLKQIAIELTDKAVAKAGAVK